MGMVATWIGVKCSGRWMDRVIGKCKSLQLNVREIQTLNSIQSNTDSRDDPTPPTHGITYFH